MNKTAKELTTGDRIKPPAHERKWLKTLLTVVSVEQGKTDKGGLWINVTCSFASPYQEGKISNSVFRFRPDTLVKTF